jgi:hypothetical protein
MTHPADLDLGLILEAEELGNRTAWLPPLRKSLARFGIERVCMPV